MLIDRKDAEQEEQGMCGLHSRRKTDIFQLRPFFFIRFVSFSNNFFFFGNVLEMRTATSTFKKKDSDSN